MGIDGSRECVKDDFQHPDMLNPGRRNSNDTNPDGIFVRDRYQPSRECISNFGPFFHKMPHIISNIPKLV